MPLLRCSRQKRWLTWTITFLRCLEIFHLPLGGDDAKGYRTAVRALAHHQLEGLLLLLVPFQYFAALPFL